MQVKAISAPAEAHGYWFGSAGAFLATSPNVASFTHVVDPGSGWADVQPSAWVTVPFGRDVLVAACMLSEGYGLADVASLTDDGVREWAIGEVLHGGTDAAKDETDSAPFRSGYRDDPAAAEFFTLACARIDAAFGFTGPAVPAPGDRQHRAPHPSAVAPGDVPAPRYPAEV